MDIIISTALIPGKKAPVLVKKARGVKATLDIVFIGLDLVFGGARLAASVGGLWVLSGRGCVGGCALSATRCARPRARSRMAMTEHAAARGRTSSAHKHTHTRVLSTLPVYTHNPCLSILLLPSSPLLPPRTWWTS